MLKWSEIIWLRMKVASWDLTVDSNVDIGEDLGGDLAGDLGEC